MRLLLDLIRNRIAQAKFNTAWNLAKNNYPLTKIIWTTIDLRQRNAALSIDGRVKIVAFDADGNQVYETKPKFRNCYKVILMEDTADTFSNNLAYIFTKAEADRAIQEGDVSVEVANYGQEFGYLKVEVRGACIVLGDEGGTLI